MKLVDAVRVCEVGPRDGLQNEKQILKTEDKIHLIEAVAEAGVSVIEVGSFVHPKAVPQMADTDEVFRRLRRKDGVEYRALVANLKGVERAAACGCTKVKLNVSASKAHNLANLNCTPAESVTRFAPCVELAKRENMEISGSISMAFGSPWDRQIPLSDVQELVDAYLATGVTEISLSDASGQANPRQVFEVCTKMAARYPQVDWWLHFHNTRGLGIANMVAGMQAGFTRFDASFAGVGGCPFVPGATGNVATEDALHLFEQMGVQTGVDLQAMLAVSRRVVELLGHPTDSYVLKAGRSNDLIREIKAKS